MWEAPQEPLEGEANRGWLGEALVSHLKLLGARERKSILTGDLTGGEFRAGDLDCARERQLEGGGWNGHREGGGLPPRSSPA